MCPFASGSRNISGNVDRISFRIIMVCVTLQTIKIHVEEMHWATGILQNLRVSYTIDSVTRQASNYFLPTITMGNKSMTCYCPSITNLNIMHFNIDLLYVLTAFIYIYIYIPG